MKVYVRSSKFYNRHLTEDEALDRLKIPAASVKGDVFKYVDSNDLQLFQYLVDNKVIPTIVSSGDIRNNPYYELEDKLIKVVRTDLNSKTYSVPVAGSGWLGEGSLVEYYITVYDNGSIRFGSGNIIDPYKLKPSTLKSYFYKYGY